MNRNFFLLLFIFCFITQFTWGVPTFGSNQPELKFNTTNVDLGITHYDLNQLVSAMEDSITLHGTVIIPSDATEYEKLLFTARRIQHNDSQIVAIKLFRYLLEFEYYRNEGEKQFIQLLLANSLDYVGSSLIAYSSLKHIFPDFINKINDKNLKCYFLSHYGGILVKLDSLEKAKTVFFQIIKLNEVEKDSSLLCSARNNYGYVLKQLKQYDSAKYYFRLNQNQICNAINPILHAFSYGNYGSVLLETYNYDSAIYYTKKEIELLSEISTKEGFGNACAILGEAYLAIENYDSAKHYYHISLSHHKKTNNLKHLTKNYESLLMLYAIENKFPLLQRFLEKYFLYNDSIKSQLAIKTYQDETQIGKFMQIINEAQHSKSEQDQLQRDYKELLYIIIALLGFILILIFTLISRKRNRKDLTEAYKELELKNKQLLNSHQTISESNTKNETLLKELHHRVKNNLQMISSLFNLQLNAQKLNSTTANVFRAAQDRIYSISLVHKKIYQSDQIEQMEFVDYLTDFTNEIINSHKLDVSVKIELDPIYLTIDSAIPLGLIFNELFTNSIKHAQTKDLQITITQDLNSKQRKFIYSDNGIGMSIQSIDLEKSNSIGLSLIDLLATQLEANIEFESPNKADSGFYFSIEGNFE